MQMLATLARNCIVTIQSIRSVLNFLDGCKIYRRVGRWCSENHTYLFKAYVLKLFLVEISHSYLNGNSDKCPPTG